MPVQIRPTILFYASISLVVLTNVLYRFSAKSTSSNVYLQSPWW